MDPVPRAHMGLQTHDSRMFSRIARELVGGGCRSFPVYYGSGNMLPTGNRPQAQQQPPAVQGVLNIRNVAIPDAVDAPVVGIPVHAIRDMLKLLICGMLHLKILSGGRSSNECQPTVI